MPVEVKPLFRPDVVRPRVTAFSQTDDAAHNTLTVLTKWRDLLTGPGSDKLKEQEILPDFMVDIFGGVLGYQRPVDAPENYTMSQQKHVQVDGKFADAVLGEFSKDNERYVVAVEGKGPTNPLDRPFKSRKMSAVDQGYRYAINLPCDWVIVTSMRETRLYYKGADQFTFERFEIIDLVDNERLRKKFVYLLGAERVLRNNGTCHLDELRTASDKVGRDLTKDFYLRYADIREDVFEQLCANNSEVSRHDILSAAQKMLDRILFCAFCEDRGLLPDETLKKAFEHADPYHPRPIWDNFQGLFRSIDKGNAGLKIPAYNGGLFAADTVLDALTVPDAICRHFKDLGDYEYRPASYLADVEQEAAGTIIDVDILGHIFEQSITDLEHLRNELDGLVPAVGKEKHKTRRKKDGAFYTPAFITRYIVEQALGGVLKDRFEQLRHVQQQKATGTATKVLDDPNVYDVAELNERQKKALIKFWETWQDELKTIRILDPAVGSGAFLIEAFDQLHKVYEQSNDRLEEIRGHRTLFDLDREILQNNLYGVDLNAEAVQICRLSLWIKTAAQGKQLTSLDHNIRVGNSVVNDPDVHPLAFDWDTAFPEVTKAGGFDVVVANPPYIRAEWIKEFKSHWEHRFKTYAGGADIYTYFYELGINLLRERGQLSFVVTNKWMKADYGGPLRAFFATRTQICSVVDFGHAKQIFEQADVFPSVITIAKRSTTAREEDVEVCVVPREQLRIEDLSRQVGELGFLIPRTQLGEEPWLFDPPALKKLYARMKQDARPLPLACGEVPLFGIKTGLNEAFLIDDATRNQLVKESPAAADVIEPYLRGRDIKRWSPDWQHLWIILMKSSGNHNWPWRGLPLEKATEMFATAYPSVFKHLNQRSPRLQQRSDQGEYWWELRSCAYYDSFDGEKIMWQDIGYHSRFCLCPRELIGEATVFTLPVSDLWVLAVLNSPLLWSWLSRNTIHGKDEALRLKTTYMKNVPIATPTMQQRDVVESAAQRLNEITITCQETERTMRDWLIVEHGLEKLGNQLAEPVALGMDDFVAEVRKRRGKKRPLTAAGLKSLRDEYTNTIEPAKALRAEAAALEIQINDRVNEAYGLTPEDIDLMGKPLRHECPSRVRKTERNVLQRKESGSQTVNSTDCRSRSRTQRPRLSAVQSQPGRNPTSST